MTNFDSAFEEVQLLVEDFEKNISHYLRPEYSEAQVRLDFIDKFFIALGWDVRNDNRFNPLQREVLIEKTQRQQQSKAQKRADYAFYLAPDFKNVKFFVEVKKPSRNLKNSDDYFQTARYGWNAGIGISILTDFEEFHIIDCRFKPDINKVFNAHNKTLHFTDYKDKDKFAELYWLFSKEAALAGNIDAYVDKLPKPKKGASQTTLFGGKWQSIDESFLEYIDEIRETIAKALKKNDNHLTSDLLTEAAQRTVDRLVFIRFLEDKLIEPENYVSEFGNRTTAWKDFINTCRILDVKYNGIVFKKHFIDEQNFTGADDAHFKSICNEISHLNTPYDFNVIPIHILGSIYERFLGKVVVATDKRVKIEEKPEVRKAGGVYYTPKYVVDYIVKNTVGKLIEGKKPAEIAKLKFADIACGSGSFLIGVLDYLIVYHTNYYNKYPDEAKKDKCLQIDGLFVLSIKQKQKILTNNIYGVDIDHQATEVTQLSLYLKMLEDETTATANEMQVLFHEKILPDLSNNIKCGNSLIGTDILTGKLFDFEEEKTLNPFDFHSAFQDVFKQGGFDAIVGNPPYVTEIFSNSENNYFNTEYVDTIVGKPNLYRLFVHRACKLLKREGKLGYIIPNSYLTSRDSIKFRNYLLSNVNLEEILFFPENLKVFKDVTQATTILLLSIKKILNQKDNQIKIIYPVLQTEDLDLNPIRTINQTLFHELRGNIFLISRSEEALKIILKSLNNCLTFDVYVDVYQGEINVSTNKDLIETECKNDNYKPLIRGNNISRYFIDLNFNDLKGSWLNTEIKEFRNHLLSDRIVTQEVSNMQQKRRLNGMPLEKGIYVGHTANYLMLKDSSLKKEFFIGLLNSFYLDFIFQSLNSTNHIPAGEIKKLPIPKIDFNNNRQKLIYDLIVNSVSQILESKKNIATIQSEREKDYLQRKSETLDIQIDSLVYQLYEITDKEIKQIEDSNQIDPSPGN